VNLSIYVMSVMVIVIYMMCVMVIVIYMMPVMNIMKCILCLGVLWIFLREKRTIYVGLSCAKQEMHDKVTKTTA
jgi:hypothetical protein